ncbi:methylecgonone reductase-like [Diospyros lotus]|uniref:methylecgonone reductase-like n=1 Tax=Diospyros lotus TaxID=55363 RepID=UPI002254D3E8|nr:methylecgonone reductase-like [Diospyros lotus]
MHVPEVKLNSGHKMPLIQMGTAADPLPRPDHLTSTFLAGIEAGYRRLLPHRRAPRGRGGHLRPCSKLWGTDAHHDLVLPAFNNALQGWGWNMWTLYLVHCPAGWESPPSLWVSANFGCLKLSKLLQNATIQPAVNRVEMTPACQQPKLRQFCKERGIRVSMVSTGGPVELHEDLLQ